MRTKRSCPFYYYLYRSYIESSVGLQWLYSGSTVALHRTLNGVIANITEMQSLFQTVNCQWLIIN
ncbi:hypothetical protein ACSQ7D_01110 [Capnocytophaga sp. G1920]|uniref:hypothetical protein n=1 Tax=Capnocytophaga sp. G1920 TaxID=3448875 RepID=UPI003EDC74A5